MSENLELLRKSLEHNVNHTHLNECFCRFWQHLIIFTEASIPVESAENSFYFPSLWDNDEAFGGFWAQHNLDNPTKAVHHPTHKVHPLIPSIDPNANPTYKGFSHLVKLLQQTFGSRLLTHISCTDDDHPDFSLRFPKMACKACEARLLEKSSKKQSAHASGDCLERSVVQGN